MITLKMGTITSGDIAMFNLVFDVFFCSIPTVILPSLHRWFRNKNSFPVMIFISVVVMFAGYVAFDLPLNLAPLIFCLLYKLFEKIIILKFGRKMYFNRKYNYFPYDPEAEKATWLEFLFQGLLCVLPLVLWIGIGILIWE